MEKSYWVEWKSINGEQNEILTSKKRPLHLADNAKSSNFVIASPEETGKMQLYWGTSVKLFVVYHWKSGQFSIIRTTSNGAHADAYRFTFFQEGCGIYNRRGLFTCYVWSAVQSRSEITGGSRLSCNRIRTVAQTCQMITAPITRSHPKSVPSGCQIRISDKVAYLFAML